MAWDKYTFAWKRDTISRQTEEINRPLLITLAEKMEAKSRMLFLLVLSSATLSAAADSDQHENNRTGKICKAVTDLLPSIISPCSFSVSIGQVMIVR